MTTKTTEKKVAEVVKNQTVIQTEVPEVFEQGMKKKTKGWMLIGIGIGILVMALVGLGFWMGQKNNSPTISKQEQAIVANVQSDTPLTSNQQAYLQKSLEEGQKSLNQQNGSSVPVNAPVVVPPSVRSDFKPEYKETPEAKGKILFKFTTDAKAINYTVKNTSDKSLFVWDRGEQKDASGKILDRRGGEEPSWFLLKPGESINDSRWQIDPEAKKLAMWVEVKAQ
ncbi:MAG: hypothetical protein AAB451_04230 [Patescibacteria group bacterium]